MDSKTSEFYKTDSNLPKRFENPGTFKGYEKKKTHPIYRTTNQAYGSSAPSVHTVPTRFKPRNQAFSSKLAPCGMYRNHSFNTGSEKSYVTENFDS